MDGATAIAYARSRSADSDYQRMGRQRQLLAALGSQIEVPTPRRERVRVKVPAGTRDGRMLRVKGRGAAIGGSDDKRGDLLVRLRVQVPDKLSRQQREALEKYAALDGGADIREELFT